MSDKRKSLRVYGSNKDMKMIEKKAKRFGMNKSEYMLFCARAMDRFDDKPDECQVIAVDFGCLNEISVDCSKLDKNLSEFSERLDYVIDLFESARYEKACLAAYAIRDGFAVLVENHAKVLERVKAIAEKIHIKISKPLGEANMRSSWQCYVRVDPSERSY